MMNRLIDPRRIFVRVFTQQITPFHSRPFHKFTNRPRLLFLTSPYAFVKGSEKANFMENFDLKLKEACDKGEPAIAELMDFLKANVTDIATAYKDCLKKQIEIVDAASKAGSTSSKWDDLPQFRTLAHDLSGQFQSFVATINTLGQIAQNETLQYITQQKQLFQLLTKKHKELDTEIKKHLEEIKKLEDKLLTKKRDSIENAK